LVNEGGKAFRQKGKILIVPGALVHLDVNVGLLPAECEFGCRGDRERYEEGELCECVRR